MASSFSMGMRSRGALAGQGAAVGGVTAQDTGTAALRRAHDDVGNSGVIAGIGGADQGYLFGALMGGLMSGGTLSNAAMQRALSGRLVGEEVADLPLISQSTDASAKARLQTQAMRLGAFNFNVPAPVQGASELGSEKADYAAPERAVAEVAPFEFEGGTPAATEEQAAAPAAEASTSAAA